MMRPSLWLVFLYILFLCCCGIRVANGDEDYILAAGPLTTTAKDVFDCSHPLPPDHRQHFEDLHSRGVTHFKVPLSWLQLLPTGLASHPQKTVVTCYHQLLTELLDVGLQPLVALHGSKVPDVLRARYGGWESRELGDLFQHYAEFAFQEFGDLVHIWLTLSDLDDIQSADTALAMQNILRLNKNIYELYHQRFSGSDQQLSIGLSVGDIATLDQVTASESMDFLSVNIQYNCASALDFEEELHNLQLSNHDLSILLYKITPKGCKDTQQLLGSFIQALNKNNLKIMGADVINMLGISNKWKTQQRDEMPQYIESADEKSYQAVLDIFASQTTSERDAFLNESFPDNFQWATSSESFKVEGGWLEGGKGETIWDRFGHENKVFGNQTADLACDSYNKVDYDVYLLRGLNVNTYQFSISWARIFPTGLPDSKSEKGVLYYDKLINTLIDSGIQPVVTLYHWDLPQALQDNGGWTNPSIVEAFKQYADFCFSMFGDRVKTWNTFSSPWVVSHAGYGTGEHAPGIKDYVVASYQVTHNMLKSHAEAWHVYNDKYRSTQGGKVGIALNSDWAEPKDPSKPEDIAAADRYLQFMLGWFAHPIFVDGDYPATLKSQIEQKRKDCPDSEPARLPVFTFAESQRIRGTADFFGLNHYTSRLVSNSVGGCTPGPEGVGNLKAEVDPSWPSTVSDWIVSVPWGLRRLLNYISTAYLQTTKVPVYITGNGMPTQFINSNNKNDPQRVEYLKNYINEALKAIEDGVDVQRFTVQSVMDGFEGPRGYSERFGLHYVNFDHPDRPRTPRQSAYYYSEIIKMNGFAPKQFIIDPATKPVTAFNTSPLPPSTVPSEAKSVWMKFSGKTNVETKLYHYGMFSEGFTWGVSSSAYQIEGGWNADGKGPSIWDTFTHAPGNIMDHANGDVACDSYHRLEEDLYMLRALGSKSYRFSLSWSRIFPDGRRSSLNQKGVDYYNKLIDGLHRSNITPIVTLYHWDLPQALQDVGGWESEDMIEIFNDFCDFCFATFGDRVKFWITFHQPQTIAWLGYGLGSFPPKVKNPGTAPYIVAHNLIKAHAKAYHTYDDKYRTSQGGLISIALNADWVEPKDLSDPREVMAADRALQFQLGWFAHPIFKNGDYPDAMTWQVGNKSELQHESTSRLPSFTEEDKNFIRGTADMFCVNHYTTMIVNFNAGKLTPPSYEDDQDLVKAAVDHYPWTGIPNQNAVAWGLRRLLNWIKEEYSNPEIYITENGVVTDPMYGFDDTDRVFYYKTYIDEALKAHNIDGVNVKGYIALSLMDSFEWTYSYRKNLGLHHVDFADMARPRTPKHSAHYYYHVMRDNGFPLPEEEKFLYREFPKTFNWSTASAAFQIEGAWRTDGKGLSIWDEFSHTPGKTANGDNGDFACDSYNKIDEDIEVLKTLKVTHYRFSMSWPRVLPDGTKNHINEAGINYYHKLLDALAAANIVPQVTLYHWDLPLALEREGGWLNETIVDRFRDYADVVFSQFGSKVKFWITHNEPYIVANLGYGYGSFAPGKTGQHYIAAHNLIKAHAEAWHHYNDNYRPTQGGIISITVNSDWAYPKNPYSQKDLDAVQRYMQFFIGWFAHPIFKGDYPELMKKTIRERSLAAGLPASRLPEFTPEEIKRINGTHDYFGLNHYCSVLAFHVDFNIHDTTYDSDRGTAAIADRTWIETGSDWLRITPFGFRKLLKFIKDEYGNPPIYVTENGVSERGAVDLNDVHRTYFYKHYINQGLKALILDGVDLRGYTAWSLMDNFEWAQGYTERFGLFYVNRSDPTFPRIPKNAASNYGKIISCSGFPENNPDCYISAPGDTDAPAPTDSVPTHTTTTPFLPPMEVDFLGLELSAEEAEVGLYVTFAFLLASVLAIIFILYRLCKARKMLKRATLDAVKLERR